jgi:hypothetical protein
VVDDEHREEEKKQHARELATLRKRQEHERKAVAKDEDIDAASSSSINTALMNGARAAAVARVIGDVADLSRPDTKGWRKERNGTKRGVVQNVPSKRVFWFHPFLWALIEAALRQWDWSPAHVVCALQRSYPALFDADGSRLHRGTVGKWIVPGERRLTEAALAKISLRRSLVGTGHVGILAPYSEIVDKIVVMLQGIRTSGCAVNVQIARALMIAIIKDIRPKLLEKFKCSEKFVRAFVESKLDWTMRKGIRATLGT